MVRRRSGVMESRNTGWTKISKSIINRFYKILLQINIVLYNLPIHVSRIFSLKRRKGIHQSTTTLLHSPAEFCILFGELKDEHESQFNYF